MTPVDAIFSPAHRLQYLLDFESALARALVRAKVAPPGTDDVIAAECEVARFDLEALAHAAKDAGNDVIPVVERLRALVAKEDPAAASYVHWGATSQDAMDTALVLQLRDARSLFDAELDRLASVTAALTIQHAATPIVGRTWLQHAPPTTFGLKAAGWLDALRRHRERFAALWERALVIQLGGAVGTLAVLGPSAQGVAAALAEELRLAKPEVPWHSARDRLAEVATTCGLLVGTLGKIARDVSLLMQSETDEAREQRVDGRGRSSTMPHKRNPVGCANILSASIRVPGLVSTVLSAMVQEHERGLGGWQAEWATIPEICTLTFDALEQTVGVLNGLDVDRDRMASNIDLTRGFVFAEALAFALAPKLGRDAAVAAVQSALRAAAEQGRELRDVATNDSRIAASLSPAEIDQLFDARHHLAEAEAMARRVAKSSREDV